jgi:hypothetical protein
MVTSRRYHTRLHQRNLPSNTPPTPTEDEDKDPATSSDSEDDKQGNNVLAKSDSKEEDKDKEEDKEEPPAKKPSSTKATTKKASSTTGITLKNSKSKTNKGKPAAITPKSVTVAQKLANVSPVSDEFNTNKEDRRTASVSSMTSSAARKNDEKHKRKAAALEASN